MQIRPVQPADVDMLSEIDGTIESVRYFHVEQSGDRLSPAWKLDQRPLRERVARSNALDDERRFVLKQVVGGADEGLAMMAEHDGIPVALLLAAPDPALGTLRIHDLRVDFDHRRVGLGSALIYTAITNARQHELRAVAAHTTTDNFPAAALFSKCGFDIAGLDLRRRSNHDLVKESATLLWYASLD